MSFGSSTPDSHQLRLRIHNWLRWDRFDRHRFSLDWLNLHRFGFDDSGRLRDRDR